MKTTQCPWCRGTVYLKPGRVIIRHSKPTPDGYFAGRMPECEGGNMRPDEFKRVAS